MLETLLIVLTLMVLLIASYTDLKTTEVPDWLNFGFIAIALGIRAFFSFQEGFSVLLSGIIGFVFCFILACLLYYSNQWGGGDSKLLMGMGAAIGFSYPLTLSNGQLLLFLIVLLFGGAVYGLLWMAVVAVKKRDIVRHRFQAVLQEHKYIHYSLGGFFLLGSGLSITIHSLFPLALFPLLLFYIFLFVHAVEKSCFYKRVDPSLLREGDWLAEQIVAEKNTIIRKSLQHNDIALLQNLKQKKKLHTVLIKEGIPFVPSFLLAYVVIILFNNFMLRFLAVLF